jgi:hypothetical protein
LDAVAGDYEMRAVGTVSEQPPMFGVLAATRVAWEAPQRKTARERNPESTVRIAQNFLDQRCRRTMLLEPLALRNVEDRVSLIPIKLSCGMVWSAA